MHSSFYYCAHHFSYFVHLLTNYESICSSICSSIYYFKFIMRL
nr:MAG TPA: hypothetical protein [Caudoviricetes sp.]